MKRTNACTQISRLLMLSIWLIHRVNSWNKCTCIYNIHVHSSQRNSFPVVSTHLSIHFFSVLGTEHLLVLLEQTEFVPGTHKVVVGWTAPGATPHSGPRTLTTVTPLQSNVETTMKSILTFSKKKAGYYFLYSIAFYFHHIFFTYFYGKICIILLILTLRALPHIM